MAALEIPPGIIDQIDRRRRSFLWAGSNTNSRGKSLVAWERVCDLKDKGGLGIKDLGLQNTCLLLKMIHRLHSNNASSWARWVRQNASIASLIGNLHGPHWKALRSLLPLYHALTTVSLGNGDTTSFWHDVWDGQDSMAEKFPELYSHCRNQEITVKQAFEGELQHSLVTRISVQAEEQLLQITVIMNQRTLSGDRDQRRSMMLKRSGELDAGMLYRALKSSHSTNDEWADFVWNNKAPPRVKFFAWLLSQERIKCKTTLRKKGIVDSGS